MPIKFKETVKVLVNRQAKTYKTVNSYMHTTSTDEIQKAYDNTNTKPKHRQKYRNELVRRGALNA